MIASYDIISMQEAPTFELNSHSCKNFVWRGTTYCFAPPLCSFAHPPETKPQSQCSHQRLLLVLADATANDDSVARLNHC